MSLRLTISFIALTLFVAGAELPADATFPGGNGKLAFSRHGGIVTTDPDGTDQVRLTNQSGRDYSPSWSPSGGLIAFVRSTDRGSAIWVMGADGSGRLRVSDYGRGIVQPPTWSPEGTWIVYSDSVETADGLVGAIWRVTPDGDERIRLTGYGSWNAVPAWSPDAADLVFVSDRDGDADIWTMRANGSGKTKLTQNDRSDIWPSYAPDGSAIAFYRSIPRGDSTGDKGSAIWSMDPDGSDPLQLTDGSRFDLLPQWSPDGDWIAFRGDAPWPHSGAELYRIAPDGSGLQKLTGSDTLALQFAWSPDSTKLVFVDDHLEIDVIEADGSGFLTVFTDSTPSLSGADWQALA